MCEHCEGVKRVKEEVKAVEKDFTLFWLSGKTELVKGKTVAEAFSNAGYSGGATRALDFYGEGDIGSKWEWKDKQWNKKEE